MKKNRQMITLGLTLLVSLCLCVLGLAEGVTTPTDLPLDISQGVLELESASFTYQKGVVQQPGVRVIVNGQTLDSSVYNVTYSAASEAVGEYSVKVSAAHSDYKGSLSGTYSILQQKILGDNVKVTIENGTVYDGKEHKISVVVRDQNGKELEEGKDYTVQSSANVTEAGDYGVNVTEAGDYDVIVTGVGNYTDTVTKQVKLDQQKILGDNVKVTIEDGTVYDGKEHKISVVVRDQNGKELEEGKDYVAQIPANVTEAGTCSVVHVEGKGNYSGVVEKQVKLDQAPFAGSVKVSVLETTYNGEKQEPKITVELNGEPVSPNDYMVKSDDDSFTDAKEYKLTIMGRNNFVDSEVRLTYVIKPQQLQADLVSVETIGYDGHEHANNIRVKIYSAEGKTLEQNVNYEVTCNDSMKKVGDYTVTVKGKENYTGVVEVQAQVVAVSFADKVEVQISPNQVYNGQKQAPKVTVKWRESKEELAKEDYTITYSDASFINAKTYTIEVRGSGNFAGESITNSYTIAPYDISGKDVQLEMTLEWLEKVFNDQVQKPEVKSVKVKLPDSEEEVLLVVREEEDSEEAVDTDEEEEKEQKKGDYIVTYVSEDSTQAGRYDVKITGVGNYKGDVVKHYTIEHYELTEESVTLDWLKKIFNDEVQKPGVDVTAKLVKGEETEEVTLQAGKDYELIYAEDNSENVGTYKLTVRGKEKDGNYKGEVTMEYRIDPYSLEDAVVTLDWDKNETIYNAEVQKPGVTVQAELTDGKIVELLSDENYTVSCEDSVNVQTYGLMVVAKEGSNYTGEVALKYRITPFDLGDVNTAVTEENIYNGKQQVPVICLKAFGTELLMGENGDYTVSFSDDTLKDVDTYTVTLKGRGNYKGEVQREYSIARKKLTEEDVALAWEETIYNRRVQKPNVTVTSKLADGTATLAMNVDYKLVYVDDASSDAESYKLTVQGIGNYDGELMSFDYEIKPYELTDESVTVADVTEDEFVVYNGLPKEPKPEVWDAEGQLLTQDVDVTYSYIENVTVGEAFICISGDEKNYTGCIERKLEIDWLSTDAEAVLVGTKGNEGWYKEKVVQIIAPEGYTISNDCVADVTSWHPYLEGVEGINEVTYYLRDAEGYITEARTVAFKQDTIAPVPTIDLKDFVHGATIEVRVSDMAEGANIEGVVSGPILRFYIGNTLQEEFTIATSQNGEVKVYEEVIGSLNIVHPGAYRIVLQDVAGNMVTDGEIFNQYYADSDGDTLADIFERNHHKLGEAAVNEPDFDHDGLTDGEEVLTYRTDPSVVDTDHDGLTDYDEIKRYRTNALKVDSDKDGVNDYISIAASPCFEYSYPTGLRVMLGSGERQAKKLQDANAMNQSLADLTSYHYLEVLQANLYDAFRSTSLRRQGADGIYQVVQFAMGVDNALVGANVVRNMAYGVNSKERLFVSFVVDAKTNRFTPVSAYALDELLGMKGENYSVVCDDHSTLFLVACWSGEQAQSDLVLLVPEQGTAYRLSGTMGSTRFGVSPDGSKLVFVKDGKANVIDLVSCNAAGEYTVDASALGFTEDGGVITALDGHKASVWYVDASTYVMDMRQISFNGWLDMVQPTLDARTVLVLLSDDEVLLSGEDQIVVEVQGRATLLNALRGLAFRQADERTSQTCRDFFAQ